MLLRQPRSLSTAAPRPAVIVPDDCDPAVHPEAKKFDTISIDEVVNKRLGVIDLAAAVLCMENHMPMMIFGLNEKNSIIDTAMGTTAGTLVEA